MRKLFIILFTLLLTSNSGIAQVITVLPNSNFQNEGLNNIQIGQPSGYPAYRSPGTWIDGQGNGIMGTSFFVEYGDGYFSSVNNSYHSFNTSSATAIVTSLAKYDEGHPHAKISYQQIVVNPGGNPYTQNILGPLSLGLTQKNITITSNQVDLVEKDTLQTVITFKRKFSGSGKILFYYNGDLQAFEAINPNPTTGNLSFYINDVNANSGMRFKKVRTYNIPNLSLNAAVKTPIDLPIVYSTQFQNNLSAIKYINNISGPRNSSNVLAFDISATPALDTTEHNIFITLIVPPGSINSGTDSYSNMYAYIVPDALNSQDFIAQSGVLSATQSLSTASVGPTGLSVHDPNYIRADKQCTPSCVKATSQSQQHNYRVHFQNNGSGIAHRIEITVLIDSKYIFNSIQTATIRGSVGTKEHTSTSKLSFSKTPAGLSSRWHTLKFTFYDISAPPAPNTQLSTVNLYGTAYAANPDINPLTMGDLYFSASTNTGEIPCFYSIAAIVFDNVAPVKTKLNVITCCKGRSIPRPAPEVDFSKIFPRKPGM